MGEENAVRVTPEPRTYQSLKSDLIQLGVAPEMVLLVHSSLSQVGSATSRLFSQPMAVDFAVAWLRKYGPE